jgi:WD40 repeat protein
MILALCLIPVSGEPLLAVSGNSGSLAILDPAIGERSARLKGHLDNVRTVCPMTVDGRSLLASGSDDRSVRIWDPESKTTEIVIPTPYPIREIAPLADLLAIALDGGILLVKINLTCDKLVRCWPTIDLGEGCPEVGAINCIG